MEARERFNADPASASEILEVLRANRGFRNPESWVARARAEGFTRVHSQPRESCPDCRSLEAPSFGQYIYYSTLIHLRECTGCGLVYADSLLDPRLISGHFERSYKDEQYFARQRRPVFDHIASLVSAQTLPGASVLDIGGAKGHLLVELRKRRPDLDLVLNDLSSDACNWAADKFALDTVQGSLSALATLDKRFDLVIACDVLYYEPNIRDAWRTTHSLLRPGGIAIFRIPNKLPGIRLAQQIDRIRSPREELEMRGGVKFFNPEHLYIFSRKYLSRRLARSGFARVRYLPSPPLTSGGLRNVAGRLLYTGARGLSALSRGSIVATPSQVIIAAKV